MNTNEIYKLANEITGQQVENVVAGWVASNEIKSLKTYNTLIELGDSKKLACATVMINKIETEDYDAGMYRYAYES